MTIAQFDKLPEPPGGYYELRGGEPVLVTSGNNLRGAPDLVIEVWSPSNTADEMEDIRALCLENGALEFWVVRPRAKTTPAYTCDHAPLHRSGDAVPVDPFFPGASAIGVDEIFTDAEI